MSHNMLWLLGLMCFSLCLSIFTVISAHRKMSTQKAKNESGPTPPSDSFPEAIGVHSLHQILRERQIILGQINANGESLNYFFCQPIEVYPMTAMNHFYDAEGAHNMSVFLYNEGDYVQAHNRSQKVLEHLRCAYDDLFRTTGGKNKGP